MDSNGNIIWIGPNAYPILWSAFLIIAIYWCLYRYGKELPIIPLPSFLRRVAMTPHAFTPAPQPEHVSTAYAPPIGVPTIPRQFTVNAAWIQDIQAALHLLVIGHSGGGKTSLIHYLATMIATGKRVIVCDPDAAPGLWSGCEVYGNGNDFTSITVALKGIKTEVTKRRILRGKGQRRAFPAIYLVIDEYQDVARECEDARPLVEDILRRGRKLGIHLVIGVQDKLVKTMGFEGQGDLRRNFSWIVEVKKGNDGQRTAVLVNPNDDTGPTTHLIPRLPDLDMLVDSAVDVSSISLDTSEGDHLIRRALREEDEVLEPVEEMPKNIPEPVVPRTGSDPVLSGSVAVEPLIRRMSEQGMSRNQIAVILGGNRQKALDTIRRTLDENT